jgi:hypothetical protein
LKKILVLPGFEFTATFGFHVLGVFSPDKPIREIEHLLLSLNVPPDQLDEGSVTVGASADVLTCYRLINEAGGLAIAAHANSNNGVAMRGFPFGGQTKIAYTQDSSLHALEVTDLERKGGRSTASFFSGAKPEYPRRMHCIQGSDAHRLETDPQRAKNLGVGDRVTEVLLPEVSFEAVSKLLRGNDFARSRPRRQTKEEPDFDFIRAAREAGSNIIQDFHEKMTVRGGALYAIIADVCAFANTNGGTLYIGLSSDPKGPIAGVGNPAQAARQLEKEIASRISPPIHCTVDVHQTAGKNIIRILVPRGEERPYALEDNKIYIREEADTGLAVRDEIVELVRQGRQLSHEGVAAVVEDAISLVPPRDEPGLPSAPQSQDEPDDLPPLTGVEIVSVEKRNGTDYYTVRDLRNGNMVKNVTQQSARRLWHYAITSYAKLPEDTSKLQAEWKGNLGLLRRYQQGKSTRYDLVKRDGKETRFYFGVTDDGIRGAWQALVGEGE